MISRKERLQGPNSNDVKSHHGSQRCQHGTESPSDDASLDMHQLPQRQQPFILTLRVVRSGKNKGDGCSKRAFQIIGTLSTSHAFPELDRPLAMMRHHATVIMLCMLCEPGFYSSQRPSNCFSMTSSTMRRSSVHGVFTQRSFVYMRRSQHKHEV